MVLSWGKPKIEIAAYVNGALPSSLNWTAIETPVEDTAELVTTAGDKTKAKEAGGGVVDIYAKKNEYEFSFELFIKKGSSKPIEDEDGVIITNYAVRVTPQDEACQGFLMEKTAVSCEETWSGADGGKWKYTFDGLKPEQGNILKPYTKGA